MVTVRNGERSLTAMNECSKKNSHVPTKNALEGYETVIKLKERINTVKDALENDGSRGGWVGTIQNFVFAGKGGGERTPA